MVPVLIALRRTIAGRQRTGAGRALMVISVVLAGLAAIATLWVDLSALGSRGWVDVVALTTLLWVGGRLAQSALGGEPVLRPELFALLPLRRRRLAWALLVVGLLDPANAFLVVALGAVIVGGVTAGPLAAVTGVVCVVVTVAATSVCATLAAGLFGPGSARGRDLGTMVVAVSISVLAMTGTMLPSLLAVLRERSMPWLSVLLSALPTGWAPLAVEESARGSGATTLGLILGLVVLTGIACLVWPIVLGRRMAGGRPARHGTRGRGRPHRMIARHRVSAVTAKELRLWVRDPIRLTFLVIALVVGTGTAIVPQLTAGTDLLLPYGGTMTALIAAACACNLYGGDGTGLWLTVATPRSAGADVVGRQVAWLVLVGPYAILSTLGLTALAHHASYWPWALSLLAAILGGGAGLVPLCSVIMVQPLDAAGNPTAPWSLKIHVALVIVALTAVPPLVVLLLTHGSWWAVPVGLVSGLAFMIGGAYVARRRLATRQVAILERLAT